MLARTRDPIGPGPRPVEEDGMERRHLRRLPIWLVAVAIAAGLGFAASAIASGGSPSAARKATACPFKGGKINMYMAQDIKAVIGDEIGPAGVRAADGGAAC